MDISELNGDIIVIDDGPPTATIEMYNSNFEFKIHWTLVTFLCLKNYDDFR